MTLDVVSTFILTGVIVTIGFFADLFFKKTQVPDLIWILLFGLIIGPFLGLITPSDFLSWLPIFSALALLFILFDAGLNMNFYEMLREIPRGFFMTVMGFLISIFLVTIPSFFILNIPIPLALLLGVIVGGVSSAIVVPIVRNLKDFRESPALILQIESAMTDPLCIVVAIALIGLATTGSHLTVEGFSSTFQAIISSFSISIVLGFLAGLGWLMVFQKIKEEKYAYVLTLGFLFLIFSGAEMMKGNGAIVGLLVGLVLGNGREFARMLKIGNVTGLGFKTKFVHAQISFFIRAYFFVLLGVTITFTNPNLFFFGIFLTVILLAGRAFVVQVSSIRSDFTKKEKSIMTFMFPRGLAAAVLASIPFLEYSIQGTQIFPEIVFSVILCTAVISTIGVFATERKKKAKIDLGKELGEENLEE